MAARITAFVLAILLGGINLLFGGILTLAIIGAGASSFVPAGAETQMIIVTVLAVVFVAIAAMLLVGCYKILGDSRKASLAYTGGALELILLIGAIVWSVLNPPSTRNDAVPVLICVGVSALFLVIAYYVLLIITRVADKKAAASA